MKTATTLKFFKQLVFVYMPTRSTSVTSTKMAKLTDAKKPSMSFGLMKASQQNKCKGFTLVRTEIPPADLPHENGTNFVCTGQCQSCKKKQCKQ
jgi:hypothetical protein